MTTQRHLYYQHFTLSKQTVSKYPKLFIKNRTNGKAIITKLSLLILVLSIFLPISYCLDLGAANLTPQQMVNYNQTHNLGVNPLLNHGFGNQTFASGGPGTITILYTLFCALTVVFLFWLATYGETVVLCLVLSAGTFGNTFVRYIAGHFSATSVLAGQNTFGAVIDYWSFPHSRVVFNINDIMLTTALVLLVAYIIMYTIYKIVGKQNAGKTIQAIKIKI